MTRRGFLAYLLAPLAGLLGFAIVRAIPPEPKPTDTLVVRRIEIRP